MKENSRIRQVRQALQNCLRHTGWEIVATESPTAAVRGYCPDLVAELRSGPGQARLLVEVASSPRPSTLGDTVALMAGVCASDGTPTAAAVFVPRLTPALKGLLEQAGVGYLDLSGACRLRWPGMYLERPGQPSARPAAAPLGAEAMFGRRATARHRVLRVLLSYPGRSWHQKELAQEAEVSSTPAHQVAQFLLREYYGDYEGRGPSKRIFLTRPRELLENWAGYWRDSWRAVQATAEGFFSLAGSSEQLQQDLRQGAAQAGARLGLTLSAGANCLGSFLRDDTLHAYVRGSWERLAQAADLEPVARGANVVLLPVGEEGLLYLPQPVRERLGLPAGEPLAPVAPVQLYLDLCAAGGRWAEQAPRLREEVLGYD